MTGKGRNDEVTTASSFLRKQGSIYSTPVTIHVTPAFFRHCEQSEAIQTCCSQHLDSCASRDPYTQHLSQSMLRLLFFVIANKAKQSGCVAVSTWIPAQAGIHILNTYHNPCYACFFSSLRAKRSNPDVLQSAPGFLLAQE